MKASLSDKSEPVNSYQCLCYSCSRREYLRQCLNLDSVISPTPLSSLVATHSVLCFSLLCIPLSVSASLEASSWRSFVVAVCIIGVCITMAVLCRQPQDLNKPPFSVPLVPWLPASSVLINILLTTKLSWQTWIRFSVW